jgi:hypothetical protein
LSTTLITLVLAAAALEAKPDSLLHVGASGTF